MKLIPLSGKLGSGKSAMVDDRDFEWLNQWKWHAHIRGYAYRGSGRILMHREIAGATKSQDVDHKNGDKLNNQRSNLRCCTPSQNNANQGLYKSNSSGYKGVSWKADCRKWQVKVRKDGRYHYMGLFGDIREAAKAYNTKALELYGEFAYLNDVR